MSLPAIPEDAPPHAHTFRRVLESVLAPRRLTEPAGTPLPLSAPWLVSWSGVDEQEIRRGKDWHERRGLIEKAEQIHVGKPRPLQLWKVVGEVGTEVTDEQALELMRAMAKRDNKDRG